MLAAGSGVDATAKSSGQSLLLALRVTPCPRADANSPLRAKFARNCVPSCPEQWKQFVVPEYRIIRYADVGVVVSVVAARPSIRAPCSAK